MRVAIALLVGSLFLPFALGSNSGYTERTDFYLDDFMVYTEDPGWA